MKLEKLSIRPYARLLTMLGDQLIKNERIALVELIKNAYDADADWVEVRFDGFTSDMSASVNSKIVVRDNGSGMTREDIRNAWMNPAAPQKYIRKKEGISQTPKKKRIIQGEKGIGRFAILKLGKLVTITTRTKNSGIESTLKYDFSNFDNDFTEKNGKPTKGLFLDNIEIPYSESNPNLLKESQGTVIEIRDLKGVWSRRVIDELRADIATLTDPVSRITGQKEIDDFRVSIICNGKSESVEDQNAQDLKGLIENKSVLKIEGEFSNSRNVFSFLGGTEEKAEIGLNDPKIKGLWIWKQYFKESGNNRDYECGDFKFNFYIFDFSKSATGKYMLNQQQKKILKNYRVYLYRDNVRVYPYGDHDDDWLNIDVARGTSKAGNFFSNDHLVGWIDISQKNNPKLRDKTNREGLIEEGQAVSDFKFLISVFLSYIKQYPYSRYEQKKQDRSVLEIVQSQAIASSLAGLKAKLEEQGHSSEAQEITKIARKYKREKDYLVQRAETTEDLAGVGLSVEMTSHDIMLMMGRASDIGREIARLSRSSGGDEIQEQADRLVGVLAQISNGMQDVQSLFKSSKRRKKALKIEPILDNIFKLYESLLKKKSIRYKKVISQGSPLVADTTDGVVMQVLINLFDNASYWLDMIEKDDKEIVVTVNGDAGDLVFSDNGPGIDKEDQIYVFEPFYSGKGREGRGLGLYIARQLLERHDYSISLAEGRQKKLSGANFVVSFAKEVL